MKTNNNQIIHDMHIEDLTQVKNYDEIGFEVGRIKKEYDTFQGTQLLGKPYYFIKSAGIYFPISKESAETIIDKMARLIDLKRCVEEAEKYREESEQELAEKVKEWHFVKVHLLDKKEITIPKDAIGVKRIKNDITWFVPGKKEK